MKKKLKDRFLINQTQIPQIQINRPILYFEP